ncbi:hypothetical protein ORV05_00020 [Amycolatopsis cynarae]|uniref:Uncharacterized protein n=1 Tax=Amycolatopsis cynarae TaxID=2995223 RepID=A0ABY7B497_9PSEU|nr:hypothetical protein [Amycolatopsis sp. HUAS 11-8]WAL66249.1 hypothetical protein ORV05_00020 [Amycolatopsis sp. HUAS 11-8]
MPVVTVSVPPLPSPLTVTSFDRGRVFGCSWLVDEPPSPKVL